MKKLKETVEINNSSLSKYIAQAGIASRRKATDLIKQGLVKVNGTVIKEPGFKVQETDAITVDDKSLKTDEKIYILLNKPKDYITTVSDEKGRKTVMALVQNAIGQRLYPVGRLDRNTTGLLLLTNDGQLAQRLAHPRYAVQKTYVVALDALLNPADMQRIQNGIALEDGLVTVDEVSWIRGKPRNMVKVILHSGKNRVIRRIFESLGYHVVALDRIGYSFLTKKDLRVGEWRFLLPHEIARLLAGRN